MKRLSGELSRRFVLIVASLAVLFSCSNSETIEYELVSKAAILATSDPPYSLTNETTNNIPPTMMGLMVGDAGIYICDDITNQLKLIDWNGHERFSVGSRGTGPEDHVGPGEPIVWPGCAVARTDCSMSPKVICYDDNGNFLRAIRVRGFPQYLRIIRGNTRAFGVAMSMEWSSNIDVTLSVHITSISDEGELIDSVEVTTRHLRVEGRPREEDFEVVPRIASDGRGRIYVNRDVYSWDVECYDENLTLLWRSKRDVTPALRLDHEPEQVNTSGMIRARYRHVIQQIYPRANEEVWIAGADANKQHGELHLSRFDDAGRDVGAVVICGLPQEAGDLLIVDDRAVWKRDDDVRVDGEQPYLVLYDLVLRRD